ALMTLYKLIWEDFCSWYLEVIKPEYGKPIDAKTYSHAVSFFEIVLKALHPSCPSLPKSSGRSLANGKKVQVLWLQNGQRRALRSLNTARSVNPRHWGAPSMAKEIS